MRRAGLNHPIGTMALANKRLPVGNNISGTRLPEKQLENRQISFVITKFHFHLFLSWYVISEQLLSHWGQVTHICIGNPTIISSDIDLLPGQHQTIYWTNAGILFIGSLGTNLSEMLIEILTVLLNKMHL